MERHICQECGEHLEKDSDYCTNCQVLVKQEVPESSSTISSDSIGNDSENKAITPEFKLAIDQNRFERNHDSDPNNDENLKNRLESPISPPKNNATDDIEIENTRRPRGSYFRRMIPVFTSFAIVLISWLFVKDLIPSTSFIGRLLFPIGGLERQIVPLAIMFMFFWVCLDMIIRRIQLSRELSLFGDERLIEIADGAATEEPENLILKLDNMTNGSRKRHVYYRLKLLFGSLYRTQSAQRTHDLSRHRSENEAEAVVNRYSIPKMLIWAMPILGFIGTVMGIGFAVGEFSGFLTGDIESIDLIKGELSKVTSGLSYAFDTTLLGLIASMFAMIIMSLVQNKDESFLNEVEELELQIITDAKAAMVSGTQKSTDNTEAEAIIKLKEAVKTQSNELCNAVSEFSNQVENMSTKVNESLKDIPTSIHNSRTAFETSLTKVSNELIRCNAQLVDKLSNVSSTAEDTLAKLPQELDDQKSKLVEEFDNLSGQIKESISELATANSKAGEKFIDEINNYADNLAKLNKESNDRIDGLNNATTELEQSVSSGMKNVAEELKNVTDKATEIIQARLITGETLQSLNRFKTLLESMQSSQATTVGILQQLTKPFEFRLVTPAVDETGKTQS